MLIFEVKKGKRDILLNKLLAEKDFILFVDLDTTLKKKKGDIKSVVVRPTEGWCLPEKRQQKEPSLQK